MTACRRPCNPCNDSALCPTESLRTLCALWFMKNAGYPHRILPARRPAGKGAGDAKSQVIPFTIRLDCVSRASLFVGGCDATFMDEGTHYRAEPCKAGCGRCATGADPDGPAGRRLAGPAAGMFLLPLALAVAGAMLARPRGAAQLLWALAGLAVGTGGAAVVARVLRTRRGDNTPSAGPSRKGGQAPALRSGASPRFRDRQTGSLPSREER